MNPFAKLILDLGPLVVFFGTYYAVNIYWATGVFMAATLIAASLSYAFTRRIPPLMIFSTVVVMIFGGLTLWLQDPTFIKVKPTIYYATVSAILAGGLIFGRLVIKDVMDLAVHLSDEGWRKLTIRISAFFFVLAILNEVVWRNFSEQTWVALKVWGFLPLTFIFFMAQTPLLMRYEIKSPNEDSQKTTA
ncbi:MAG: septation protein A [Alphaproteobacteria bacterium]|nr:septation protein A [Alphaproteobacteria bacterium]